ncbi:hypothetical protein CISG_09563 [Coccidioides immitis RMSCC 3703]|uniref:Uncharacterized protein n=1 Tax=Coccidioides immitis RMSCC 3703 TaxID=454286 RepID=A0A0J8U5D1_COCIT|nr:hypothetical protein CISG_09563 [Coccidioides immitis RMSCC 3703]
MIDARFDMPFPITLSRQPDNWEVVEIACEAGGGGVDASKGAELGETEIEMKWLVLSTEYRERTTYCPRLSLLSSMVSGDGCGQGDAIVPIRKIEDCIRLISAIFNGRPVSQLYYCLCHAVSARWGTAHTMCRVMPFIKAPALARIVDPKTCAIWQVRLASLSDTRQSSRLRSPYEEARSLAEEEGRGEGFSRGDKFPL